MEFTKFDSSSGGQMFDREMEQRLDDFIQTKIDEGLDDEAILESFSRNMGVLGGPAEQGPPLLRTQA